MGKSAVGRQKWGAPSAGDEVVEPTERSEWATPSPAAPLVKLGCPTMGAKGLACL